MLTRNSIKSMLKIFKKKYFLFQSCKNKHNKTIITFSLSFKQTKKRLLLLIPENTGDRAFSVFQELNISNVSIFIVNIEQISP